MSPNLHLKTLNGYRIQPDPIVTYTAFSFPPINIPSNPRVFVSPLPYSRSLVVLVSHLDLGFEMSYDEVEIEDMEWSEELKAYTYPCPCGDLFQITMDDLRAGEEIARCPSCSLFITVVYNPEDFADKPQKKTNPQPIAVA